MAPPWVIELSLSMKRGHVLIVTVEAGRSWESTFDFSAKCLTFARQQGILFLRSSGKHLMGFLIRAWLWCRLAFRPPIRQRCHILHQTIAARCCCLTLEAAAPGFCFIFPSRTWAWREAVPQVERQRKPHRLRDFS